jgi:hypothetical protein
MFFHVKPCCACFSETVLKKLLNRIKEQRSVAESEMTQPGKSSQENLGRYSLACFFTSLPLQVKQS